MIITPSFTGYHGNALDSRCATCVRVHVYFHVHLLVKTHTTEVASEGFEVGVSAHVCVQVGGPVEGFLTHGADVGLDCGVGESVTRQVPRLSEGSTTNLTLKRLLSSVDSL